VIRSMTSRLDLWADGYPTQSGLVALQALAIAIVMAGYGYAKRSLSKSGAVAAVVIGTLTFFSSMRFGIVLIAFFVSSSRITKVNSKKKAALDAEFREGTSRSMSDRARFKVSYICHNRRNHAPVGGQRSWVQVLANSLTATVPVLRLISISTLNLRVV